MPASSPITRQTVGKTFIVASSVLGIAALVQVGAITWAFMVRYREISQRPPVALRATPPRPALVASQAEPEEALANADPLAELASLPAAAASSPAAPTPRMTATTLNPPPITPPPKPMPIAAATPRPDAPPATRFDELIEQGKILRERGDMQAALTKWREAQALDPQSPLAMAEIALTFEKMGMADRAAEQWKRIYEMGESAGSYYIAADARLKQSQAMALLHAQPAAAASGAEGPVSQSNPNAALGVGIVTSEEQTDAEAARKFLLRVPLKARPRTRVEVRDVVIQVLFYDQVDGKDVVQTSANVNNRWGSPPPDWSDGDTEVLEVEYLQPKPDPTATKSENRKYFGYIVRLYYKDDLQDSRAEPVRLGAQFPAPTSLPKDTTP